MVRNGSDNRGMPGFGPSEITDTELNNLISWHGWRRYGRWRRLPGPGASGRHRGQG
jgi:hypothetical protein